MGGGGFSMEDTPVLDDFILSLARRERPRILFLPTATGNVATYAVNFYAAFAGRAEPSHLDLFVRRDADLRSLVLRQDVVYVGGGNTANMLAIWRVHGLDDILREAWQTGVVLAGLSAGALCWFDGGPTDSFGPLEALTNSMGLLPGSFCPHYDGEPERRPVFHRLVGSGALPAGYAADDGAALVFAGTTLSDVVSSRPGAMGYRVDVVDGVVAEQPLPTRFLGE